MATFSCDGSHLPGQIRDIEPLFVYWWTSVARRWPTNKPTIAQCPLSGRPIAVGKEGTGVKRWLGQLLYALGIDLPTVVLCAYLLGWWPQIKRYCCVPTWEPDQKESIQDVMNCWRNVWLIEESFLFNLSIFAAAVVRGRLVVYNPSATLIWVFFWARKLQRVS